MKKIVLVLLTITGVMLVQAQDLIYLQKEKSAIEAKVMRVGPMMIRYKKFSYQDGPELMIARRSVDSIVYQNGDKETFLRAKPPGPHLQRPSRGKREYTALGDNIISAGFQRHKVGFDPFGSFYYNSGMKNKPVASFYVSYERKLWKDRIGIEVAPFIGESDTKGVSLAARIYPMNSGNVRFGVGPEYHLITQPTVGSYSVESGNYYTTVYARQQSRLSAINFSGKLFVNMTPKYSFNFQFYAGKVFDRKLVNSQIPQDWQPSYDEAFFGIRLGIGYRF